MRSVIRRRGASLVLCSRGCSLTHAEKRIRMQVKLNDLDARVARIERVVSNQSLLELAQRLDAVQARCAAPRPDRGARERGMRRRLMTSSSAISTARSRAERFGGAGREPGAGAVRDCARPAQASRRRRRRPGAQRRHREQTAYDAGVRCAQGSATIRRRSRGFQEFLSDLSAQPARGECAVLARRGVLRDARLRPAAAGAFRTVVQNWPELAQSARCAAEARLTRSSSRNRSARAGRRLSQVVQQFPGHRCCAARQRAPAAHPAMRS